ncbi:Sensor histidine kinase RcsC [Neobacillus rhizosphaerae]|uniref:histidine kinase n=1 Tax=Neobacillus rhizosphaerae TaxID=2880965 RepID=A0ABN8KQ17_9BACI|nr:HAMP domain-containing sensor histidine kinase [Neobacillus rhizosphaerae]CAH2714850.1 Sensor histidine kinase RcsC [Neobacillus rhizosphaerae]
MKIRFLYQLVISHLGVILVAFLLLSIFFSYYIESFVYQNKSKELISYGKNILVSLENNDYGPEVVLNQYGEVLAGRNISFSLFDKDGNILYPTGFPVPDVKLTDVALEKITGGSPLVVRDRIKGSKHEVTLVALPYLINDRLAGGILLTSPISGSNVMISQINHYLIYAILIALAVSLLLSWLLSRIHVNRIKRIQKATSIVSSGDYSVKIPASHFDDEIQELGNDFNIMVDKINRSMEEISSLESRRRQFMSDVSHELKTPLTTIYGVLEGLNHNMIPEKERQNGIALVTKEAKRLIRLINENLDYDKIRSDQILLFIQEIQVLEIIEVIKEQLYIQAAEKNIEILIQADEQLIIFADYDRLLQILINIVKNSIQFTTDGTIYIRGKENEQETIIEVEDTGIGIEESEVENIWRRFYKADVSRTNNPFGEFGLGLSIVKKLVELHNGKIEVFSVKNKGTKFILRFPKTKDDLTDSFLA